MEAYELISKAELEALRQRVEDAETHRKGLLEHTRNLEHLVQEKDSDLKQTKEMLMVLEARCYRYEQMLQDYGADPFAPQQAQTPPSS